MNKITFLFGILMLILASCADKKKEQIRDEIESTTEETTGNASTKEQQIALGEKLFSDKTCVTCHAADTKIIGPSIKEMVKIYDEKGANLVKFMKGNGEAIVDTDPGQIAIMKASLDGILKNLPPEELQALAAYMRHMAK